ncbi:type II 3-dehydroquinate dehydratase [Micrococcales bacterium 31B]|nr:type II 3-dehydroquinate dehydratase [Micrococcales bacterium 31B]
MPELPRLLLVNGPNLNLLGVREPDKYGTETLASVEAMVAAHATNRGLAVDAVQSNHEGVLLDAIHAARTTHAGVVINPGAFTHTSVALRDALLGVALPVVEVHISNVHAREAFRHHSYISDMAVAVIAGAGTQGYRFAVDVLAERLASHS